MINDFHLIFRNFEYDLSMDFLGAVWPSFDSDSVRASPAWTDSSLLQYTLVSFHYERNAI